MHFLSNHWCDLIETLWGREKLPILLCFHPNASFYILSNSSFLSPHLVDDYTSLTDLGWFLLSSLSLSLIPSSKILPLILSQTRPTLTTKTIAKPDRANNHNVVNQELKIASFLDHSSGLSSSVQDMGKSLATWLWFRPAVQTIAAESKAIHREDLCLCISCVLNFIAFGACHSAEDAVL